MKSLENMAFYALTFARVGKARGCKLEHEVAKAYGVDIIYEE